MGGKLRRLVRRIRGPVLPIGDRLIVCAVCGSAVVNPVDWHESDESLVREAESFVTALRWDLIGPADFVRHRPR
jgi:hypothetical protein